MPVRQDVEPVMVWISTSDMSCSFFWFLTVFSELHFLDLYHRLSLLVIFWTALIYSPVLVVVTTGVFEKRGVHCITGRILGYVRMDANKIADWLDRYITRGRAHLWGQDAAVLRESKVGRSATAASTRGEWLARLYSWPFNVSRRQHVEALLIYKSGLILLRYGDEVQPYLRLTFHKLGF